MIPADNDKVLEVDCKSFSQAVDRVSAISTEKSRAIKLSVEKGGLTLSASSPENGSAVEELEASYDAGPIEIGFNSRYLMDILAQIEGDAARFAMADAASPTVVREVDRFQRGLCLDADAGVKDGGIVIQPQGTAGLAIARLTLSDFRCYSFLRLETDHRPVVLTGANGAGKTNILEALSFLATRARFAAGAAGRGGAARGWRRCRLGGGGPLGTVGAPGCGQSAGRRGERAKPDQRRRRDRHRLRNRIGAQTGADRRPTGPGRSPLCPRW